MRGTFYRVARESPVRNRYYKALKNWRPAFTLASPQFPPGYREQGIAQLQSYEKSLAEQRKAKRKSA